MLTIDIELEKSLQAIAQQEHSSPNEIIKKLLSNYLRQYQDKTRPLMKKARRSEPVETPDSVGRGADIPPITQSLTGLLAKSNLNELDYKQHLADK